MFSSTRTLLLFIAGCRSNIPAVRRSIAYNIFEGNNCCIQFSAHFSSEICDRGSQDDRDKNYELVCPITESCFDQVILHLKNNFFVAEPTLQMLRIDSPLTVLEDMYLKALHESLSVMCIHTPTQEIAAVSINGIFTPSDLTTERNNVHEIKDEKIRMIYSLFTNIHKCLNLFEKYGVCQIFDIKAVSVDANHRKKGLSKDVISKSLDIASYCGCKLVKTEGTSTYSQKSFENLGFETVWERNYSAFVCENGDPVFEPVNPHTNVKIMTKLLEDH